MRSRGSLLLVLVLFAAACGDAADEQPLVTIGAPAPGVQECADVVGATVERSGSTYHFSATVRSGDTGWEKYADAWIVRTTDGTVLGERVLTHPHETEQPFTRSLGDVAIGADIDEVEIAARDSVNGFCGAVFLLAVPQ